MILTRLKRRKVILSMLLALGTLGLPALGASAQPTRVEMATQIGTVVIEIDTRDAPITAANFLRYVDRKLYDGGVFHRTVRLDNQPTDDVKIEVIQGGIDPARHIEDFPPIPLERTSVTGLRHLAGEISMARDGPETATSDFFICVADTPSLDFGGHRNPDGQGFAAFGHVVSGMEVVRRIQQSKSAGQRLDPPISILSIRRLTPGKDLPAP